MKGYRAPPVRKKLEEQKTIDVKKDPPGRPPPKQAGRRCKRTTLQIIKAGKEKQKQLRQADLKKLTIGEYQMGMKANDVQNKPVAEDLRMEGDDA